MVAVGIGSGVNTAEILGMAYDTSHAFTTSSFSTLNTLQAEIKNETCIGRYFYENDKSFVFLNYNVFKILMGVAVLVRFSWGSCH